MSEARSNSLQPKECVKIIMNDVIFYGGKNSLEVGK